MPTPTTPTSGAASAGAPRAVAYARTRHRPVLWD